MQTLAGGSVTNTIRGLESAGLGISTALVGVCRDDDRGQLVAKDLQHAGVDLSRLRTTSGLTAQCIPCGCRGESNHAPMCAQRCDDSS